MMPRGAPAIYHRDKRALIVAIVLGCVILAHIAPTTRHADSSAYTTRQNEIEYGKGGHFDRMGVHDVAWELPASGPPKGVVFFAHGCNHACGDLWPPSKDCPTCLGLPEEMRIRQTILKRGMAVVGMSSEERRKACWSELRKDGGKGVAKTLKKLLQRFKLDDLPLYVLGASSGGQLVLMLPKYIDVAGVCCQVRGVAPEELQLDKYEDSYPPVIYVHMPRHEENAAVIARDIAAFKAHSIPVSELLIQPRPVTAQFLAERSAHITPEMARGIVKALQDNGFLDKDGLQYESPRPILDKWRQFVQPVVGPNMTLDLDKSQVTELLNLAWAKHEIVSDGLDVALTWLQNKGRKSIEQLSKQAA